MVARLVLLLIAVGFLPANAVTPALSIADEGCRGRGTSVVVHTRQRALFLCDGGTRSGRYPVALGAGGLGKRREGDERTPLGAYPLGPPRASKSYGTFVPVGYPTAAQARLGFTGGAIGIHGPPRALAHAGGVSTAMDWTAGCIAVGSDDEAQAIAAWVRARPHPTVHIE